MQSTDPVAVRNILALKKKEFEIKFDLSNSKYDPVETIGTGAYGVVCSAVHRVTKQRVAIKKIPDIFSQDTIAKRTLREVRILKHFKHDNIISIREILKPTEPLDKFRDIYIVLDLMESDMHKVIHSKQDLTDEHIRYFLYQILRGLKYIHSANVVHRDLKPSNLLVNENCDLKIGDFGMARGVSSNPDEFNHMLTIYVATRWYRAPEIMMTPLAYSGAIDMWSVGCILAEMLGRRQLFPGRDYGDQLKLIIGIVGSPSKELLSKIQSKNIRNFIYGLGKKEPESFKRLYPKAKNKAINLLENMLVLDPARRMTVDQALKHPYLSTYHDPDDEPVCIPTFDFSFEEKDLSARELKECITKEIMDYHKPKPQLTFDFRPVPKSELLKTSPKVLKTTTNPAFSKLDQEKCGQIAAQMRAKQLKAASENSRKETIKTEHLQPTETDIEMLSAKLSAAKVDEASAMAKLKGDGKNVAIKTKQLQTSDTDIEMLSAKLSATKVDHDSGASVLKPSEQQRDEAATSIPAQKPQEEAKPVNAKEALKMALLNARLNRQQGVEKKRPVTALQRQRENEEKKKKKLAKLKEKKKKEKEKESPMKLTSDDLQMLERWKTMQSKPDKTSTQPEPHPITTTSNSNSNGCGSQGIFQSSGNQTSHSGCNQATLQQDSTQVLQQGGNQAMLQQGATQMLHQGGNQGSLHQGFTTQAQVLPTQPAFHASNFNVNGAVGNMNQIAGVSTFQTSAVSKEPPPYVEAVFGRDSTPPFTSANTQSASVQLQEETLPNLDLSQGEPFATYSQGMKHLSPSDLLFGSDPMSMAETSRGNHSLAVTTSQFNASLSGPVFMASNPVLHPQSHAAAAEKSHQLPGNPALEAATTSHHPHPQPQPQSQPQQNITPAAASSEIPSDFLSYLQKVTRGRGDGDLTVVTPKGTGAGYGVGLDLDAILADSQPPQGAEARLDSAPLSASLIQDWMDMTGNLDTKELENLELEIGMPMGFNDFGLMKDTTDLN